MKHFLINFVDNKSDRTIRRAVKFEGDLLTAKKFSMALAKRLRGRDIAIYIYDSYEYYIGGKCLAKLRYKKTNKE